MTGWNEDAMAADEAHSSDLWTRERESEARDYVKRSGRQPAPTLYPDDVFQRRSENAERGRTAEAPSQIPDKGWKHILLRAYRGIADNRILANAAAATFYALLALFPVIAALVSIY